MALPIQHPRLTPFLGATLFIFTLHFQAHSGVTEKRFPKDPLLQLQQLMSQTFSAISLINSFPGLEKRYFI